MPMTQVCMDGARQEFNGPAFQAWSDDLSAETAFGCCCNWTAAAFFTIALTMPWWLGEREVERGGSARRAVSAAAPPAVADAMTHAHDTHPRLQPRRLARPRGRGPTVAARWPVERLPGGTHCGQTAPVPPESGGPHGRLETLPSHVAVRRLDVIDRRLRRGEPPPGGQVPLGGPLLHSTTAAAGRREGGLGGPHGVQRRLRRRRVTLAQARPLGLVLSQPRRRCPQTRPAPTRASLVRAPPPSGRPPSSPPRSAAAPKIPSPSRSLPSPLPLPFTTAGKPRSASATASIGSTPTSGGSPTARRAWTPFASAASSASPPPGRLSSPSRC